MTVSFINTIIIINIAHFFHANLKQVQLFLKKEENLLSILNKKEQVGQDR